MDETALSDKWDGLVSAHFQDLQRKTRAMVTQDDEVDEVLLAELDWSVSEAKLKELVEGDIAAVLLSFHCMHPSEFLQWLSNLCAQSSVRSVPPRLGFVLWTFLWNTQHQTSRKRPTS